MNEKAAGERLVQSEGWDKKKRECEGKRREKHKKGMRVIWTFPPKEPEPKLFLEELEPCQKDLILIEDEVAMCEVFGEVAIGRLGDRRGRAATRTAETRGRAKKITSQVQIAGDPIDNGEGN